MNLPQPMAGAIAWLGAGSGHGCWGSPADLAIPLDDRGLLGAATARSGIGTAPGSTSRGIDLAGNDEPRFWLQLSAIEPCFAPLRVIVSPTEPAAPPAC